jgi:hypothetical protein
MATNVDAVSTWRRVLGGALDFFTSFLGIGYVIAQFTGETTVGGFSLNGGSAVLLFGLVAAYFYVGRKYAGGTLWDRFFGIPRP